MFHYLITFFKAFLFTAKRRFSEHKYFLCQLALLSVGPLVWFILLSLLPLWLVLGIVALAIIAVIVVAKKLGKSAA